MAHIFKHPENNSKGILVFTHKEVRFFLKFIKQTRFEKLNELQNKFLPFDEFKTFYAKEIKRIKEKYYIGIHFGWHHDNFPITKEFDFILAGKGTVEFEIPKNVLHIPLNSRAFISTNFVNKQYKEKYWDIISVARVSNFKNTDKLLTSIRNLYDLGKLYKILVIIPSNPATDKTKYYHELEHDYMTKFSLEERQYFTLLKIDDKLNWGISHTQLIEFYNRSHVFTLFTQKEGESRVIAEALLCGLPVIVKSDLIGGGRDYLNSSNSVQFDEYEHAHEAFIEAVENFDLSNDVSLPVVEHLHEDKSIENIKTYFSKLYTESPMIDNFINMDNLSNRLPAHDLSVNWYIKGKPSADLLTKEQFIQFTEELKL